MKETTTTYTWPEGSAIKRIDVRTQKNSFAVAYLYADDREEMRATRTNIRAALRLKGWGTLSDSRNGEFVLRVAGLRSGEELVSMLRDANFTNSEPTISNVADKTEKPKSLWEKIKANSLRISAVIYTLGDLFYYKGADNKFDERMALSFGSGDALLGLFGGSDDSRQLKSLLTKLQRYMESNGIEIPKNASIYVETSQKSLGLFGAIADFMHSNINSFKILSEIVGGGFVLKSGLHQNEAGKRNPFNIVSGLLIMAGWAGALLVKEKKPDEATLANAGTLDKAAAFIQEKPLRLAGYAGLTFNTLKVSDALINTRPTSRWKIGGVASMVSANYLYSISNKTVGGDIKNGDMVQDAYRIAAQIINKQPDGEMREKALEATARFFAQRTEITEHYPAARERLVKELDSQRQNPWFEMQGLAPYAASKPRTHKNVSPTELAAAHDESKVNKVANALAEKPIAPAAMKPTNTVSAVAQHAHAQAPELARAN